jgi:transcriptional regulator with XRE-family HTH domain
MPLKMEHPSSATNPIGTRLKYEMKKRGVTSSELARRAEVKTSFIYDIISGKSANPSTIKLARVADGLGVSLAYLAGHSQQESPSLSDIYHADDSCICVPRLAIDMTQGSNITSVRQDGEPFYFRRAWIIEQLHANPADIRVASVRGDSMQPTLFHNDTVLVDMAKKNPSPPGVFMIFDGSGLVAKRLEYLADHNPPGVHVISDNAQYSNYERTVDDMRIIGRVVWFSREI